LSSNLVGSTTVNCYTSGGSWTDGGYNIENVDTCGFTGTSLKNTNPQLLELNFNAGTTHTFGLSRSSPAIDRIPLATNGCGTAVTVDQRGVLRPIDGDKNGVRACDVGAYEYNFWAFLPKLQK
jgi:hypothetical protein